MVNFKFGRMAKRVIFKDIYLLDAVEETILSAGALNLMGITTDLGNEHLVDVSDKDKDPVILAKIVVKDNMHLIEYMGNGKTAFG